ncbi:MAG: aminotransferase class V-fold PLP-dependent enzyme [Anaerolineae bacterium]|nr:aminotransferase class V-fold PLP-dependent enzyme [Anaerolineae bacterium]RLC64162.1 MAG: aminotransferase class V-fold PLP-dependent enzyme [Chloroflexota bacterium]
MKIDVEKLRAEIPATEEYAYLNHAVVSPLPRRVSEAVARFVADRGLEPRFYTRWQELEDMFRQAAARLIHAEPEEITFVHSTAEGLNAVAQSLPLAAGDNVVLCDVEYPANVYPWMNLASKGVETRIIPHREGGLSIEDLEEAVDDHTRVVTVSSVEFLTGFHNDLARIGTLCRERGIYFAVDAIQSLGMIPMDVRAYGIDFLAAGGYKWLMGPLGTGLLYVRQELIEQLRPVYVGASSVVGGKGFLDYDLTFQPDATRFKLGTINKAGMAGLLVATEFLMAVGIEAIEARTRHLTDVLIADLQRRGYEIASCLRPERRSAIVSFVVPDPQTACATLHEQGVIVAPREGYIRVAPHFYNTEAEVLRVGDVLGDAR